MSFAGHLWTIAPRLQPLPAEPPSLPWETVVRDPSLGAVRLTGRWTEVPGARHAVLLGGHVRVGLEDNLWLDKGVPASNGSLVERVRQMLGCMGARAMTPAEGREAMGLKRRG
jgi:hypothetical protein